MLIGSANALRHGGEQLAAFRGLPVHAVGETTAATARDTGFAVERVGEGGLQALLDASLASIRYLRLAGADRVALQVPPHISVTERVVYRSAARELPPDIARMLPGQFCVLLHSASAARHFVAECDRLGIERSTILLACLGPRIAAAAGEGWAGCQSAPQPSDAALLELARDMCH